MKENIPEYINYRAVDPDGYEFGYEVQPKLDLNSEGKLTWICEGNTKCVFLGQIKNYRLDFKSSLKEIQ